MTLIPFLVLWLLIRDTASPLAQVDHGIVARLNEAVRDSALLVEALRSLTVLAGTWTAVVVFAITAAFLAIQSKWRLMVFVTTTGLGLAILIPVSKSLIGRARPIVDVPVAEVPTSASFPSGHAMTAVVLWGTVALVALPALKRTARPYLLAGVTALVVFIGFTRIALGVHFLSDVLAGWALGVAWLAVMVLAFRAWPGAAPVHRSLDPLQMKPSEVVSVERPRRWSAGGAGGSCVRLLAVAAGLAVLLVATGLLVTGTGADTWLIRWDRAAVTAAVDARTAGLTDVATFVNALSATSTVIAGGLTLGALSLAATQRWRPAVFVLIALSGEALLYLLVSRTVDRGRPNAPDLTNSLPADASWPSGHVAAGVVLYGAVAVVVARYWSRRAGYVMAVVTVLVALGVGAARVYLAAHYPTDVAAGMALGAGWLLACSWVILPLRSESLRFRAPQETE